MRRLLLVVLLGACSSRPDNTPSGMCARKAEDDPAVRELVMISATNASSLIENRDRLKAARKAATNRCLAGMGVQTPGGVEPIYKPPGS